MTRGTKNTLDGWADIIAEDAQKRRLSPTKFSADAHRRIHAKVQPFALDFLNHLEDEAGADQVSSLVRLLTIVWDDGFEAAAAMPCEHEATQATSDSKGTEKP